MASNVVNGSGRKRRKHVTKLTVSTEEEQFRRNKYPDDQSILATRLVCTMCGINIKHRMVSENNVHPTLEVLLCKKCKHFYDSRNVESAPSIQDKFCRWCAKDRNLLNCSTCGAKFCEGCISRNFHLSRLVFKEIEEKKWKCFLCSSKPIWPQRAISAAVKNYADVLNDTLQQRIAKCSRVVVNSEIPARTRNFFADDIATNARSGSLVSASSELSIASVRRNSLLAVAPLDQGAVKAYHASKSDKETVSVTSMSSDETDPEKCVVCWNNETVALLYPCGHYCLCATCAEKLKRDHSCCPICRSAFKDIVKVYKACV